MQFIKETIGGYMWSEDNQKEYVVDDLSEDKNAKNENLLTKRYIASSCIGKIKFYRHIQKKIPLAESRQ